MRTDIHPKWYPAARVTCACGNSFTVGLTREEIRVEICNRCHPFFTGKLKYVDTAGQVQKFQKKQQIAAVKATDLAKKKKKQAVEEEKGPKTLKEMLLGS